MSNLLLFFIICFSSYSQSKVNKFPNKDSLYPKDYSCIWMDKQDNVLGYIGNDFHRLQIHFLSIEQNEEEKTIYTVTGKTKVKNNICSFEGIIQINEIREYGNSPKHTTIIKGKYYFKEDSTKNHSGYFSGKFTSYIYWKNGKVYFNNLQRGMSDSYHNNQFEGIWTDYKTKKIKKCNWGYDRIPDSKELDVGVGEFSPNSIYIQNGWETHPGSAKTNEEHDRLILIDQQKWW